MVRTMLDDRIGHVTFSLATSPSSTTDEPFYVTLLVLVVALPMNPLIARFANGLVLLELLAPYDRMEIRARVYPR